MKSRQGMERMTMTGAEPVSRIRFYSWRVLLVFAAALALSGSPGPVLAGDTSAAVSNVKPSLKTVDIPVDGMACVVCAATVKKAVKSLDGVSRVEVSLEKRTARVTYAAGRLWPDRIVAAID